MSTKEAEIYNQQLESNGSAYIDIQTMKGLPETKSTTQDCLLPTYEQSMKDQHQSVQLSYRKLKLSFMCMLILNALLLVVVIICMMLIVPKLSKMENSDNTPSHTEDLIESAHMKCMSIKKKLHRLYRNGQMVEDVQDGDRCSMADLIDSFIQHVEESMHKEKSIQSSAFHMVSNNSATDRCSDSRTLYCLKHWNISMNTTKIKVNDETIVVPSSGPYFLYSRVVIDAKIGSNLRVNDMVTHSIRYSNTGHSFSDLETSSVKCGVMKDTMSHISYIEKIQYLEKDSMIKVALDLPKDMTMQPSVRGGAFGMFKL